MLLQERVSLHQLKNNELILCPTGFPNGSLTKVMLTIDRSLPMNISLQFKVLF
ncbi:uracil-xanthine permease domain protein [Acinetobacter baumannii 942133]|nr:uracil-xanthine permease domain protein [Acinetobacter baumannii 942133]